MRTAKQSKNAVIYSDVVCLDDNSVFDVVAINFIADMVKLHLAIIAICSNVLFTHGDLLSFEVGPMRDTFY